MAADPPNITKVLRSGGPFQALATTQQKLVETTPIQHEVVPYDDGLFFLPLANGGSSSAELNSARLTVQTAHRPSVAADRCPTSFEPSSRHRVANASPVLTTFTTTSDHHECSQIKLSKAPPFPFLPGASPGSTGSQKQSKVALLS